jgi:uncharacterized protein YbjT (DUF2867 family)
MKKYNKILVLGGTGKTGSRIVSRLNRMRLPVQPGSRGAAIPFDWEDESTWPAALKGADAVYVCFQPDLAVPGAVDIIRHFASKAVALGVKKLVLLSGRGEPEAQECEQVIMAAGVDWTIIRASWFFQNFSESHMLESIQAGYFALPVDNTGEPFVDADDIADVAVAALTEDGHDGQLYEVTGPRLLTFEAAVAEIAAAIGKPIQYLRITQEEYSAMLATHGVPAEIISLISYLFSEVLDGRNAFVTDGVERALGRKATDFSDYISKTIAAGAWDQVNTL